MSEPASSFLAKMLSDSPDRLPAAPGVRFKHTPEGTAMDDFNPTPMTDAQVAARDRAYLELVRNYPNHYVAYLDEWSGDELKRTVVLTAPTVGEYMSKMESLTEEFCLRLNGTRVSSPDAPLFASALLFRVPAE
jgi:hypothetical protein